MNSRYYRCRGVSLTAALLAVSLSAVAQSDARALDSLRALTTPASPDSTRLAALGELAFAYSRINADSAVAYAERADELARAVGDEAQRGQAANDRGAAYLAAGRYEDARAAYREAIALRTALGDSSGVAGSRTNLGSVYQRIGRLDSAIVEYQAAARVFEATGNLTYLDYVRNNTAALYEEVGDQSRAIAAYRQSLAFRQNHAAAYDQAATRINLANAQAKIDSFDVAETNYLTAVRQLEGDGEADVLLATAYNNLSGLANRRRDYRASIAYGRKGLRVAEAVGAVPEQGLLHYGLGESYANLGQLQRAYDAFRRARALSASTGDADRVAAAQLELALLAAQLGRSEEANDLARAYRRYADSTAAAGTAERMLELEAQYETARKDQALAEARSARLTDQLAARQQTLWLLSALSLALLAGAAGYLLYTRQRVRNRELAQEAELDLALARLETQERLHAQRRSISRDLHDNIGAQLTFLISGVDGLRHRLGESAPELGDRLARLGDFAGGTVRDLRDTVWAMNKDAITIDDLRGRTANFIARACAADDAPDIRLSVDDDLPGEFALPTRTGMNVYRVLQEALHNALRHACAKTVHVALGRRGDALTVQVVDDGVGFGPDATAKAEARGGGNGLHTMRQRATDIGGNLEVEGGDDSGTVVRLSLPVHHGDESPEAMDPADRTDLAVSEKALP